MIQQVGRFTLPPSLKSISFSEELLQSGIESLNEQQLQHTVALLSDMSYSKCISSLGASPPRVTLLMKLKTPSTLAVFLFRVHMDPAASAGHCKDNDVSRG